MASPAKKPKVQSKTKQYFLKQARINREREKCLDVGMQGYLITYAFKEKDAVREVYKLLNDFYKPAVEPVEKSKDDEEEIEDEEEDDDILNELSQAIDKTKQETKAKTQFFQAVETSTPGSAFVRADIPDFHELLMKIINELAVTKVKRTRQINRIIPVSKVCKAKMEDIINAAGELFDSHFLKTPSTYAIIFNRKCNNEIQREDIIKQLAELVNLKNINNKVNLKTPEKTIIVEVVKGLCLLAVAPDYMKLKKYNLHELSKNDDDQEEEEKKKVEVPSEPKDVE